MMRENGKKKTKSFLAVLIVLSMIMPCTTVVANTTAGLSENYDVTNPESSVQVIADDALTFTNNESLNEGITETGMIKSEVFDEEKGKDVIKLAFNEKIAWNTANNDSTRLYDVMSSLNGLADLLVDDCANTISFDYKVTGSSTGNVGMFFVGKDATELSDYQTRYPLIGLRNGGGITAVARPAAVRGKWSNYITAEAWASHDSDNTQWNRLTIAIDSNGTGITDVYLNGQKVKFVTNSDGYIGNATNKDKGEIDKILFNTAGEVSQTKDLAILLDNIKVYEGAPKLADTTGLTSKFNLINDTSNTGFANMTDGYVLDPVKGAVRKLTFNAKAAEANVRAGLSGFSKYMTDETVNTICFDYKFSGSSKNHVGFFLNDTVGAAYWSETYVAMILGNSESIQLRNRPNYNASDWYSYAGNTNFYQSAPNNREWNRAILEVNNVTGEVKGYINGKYYGSISGATTSSANLDTIFFNTEPLVGTGGTSLNGLSILLDNIKVYPGIAKVEDVGNEITDKKFIYSEAKEGQFTKTPMGNVWGVKLILRVENDITATLKSASETVDVTITKDETTSNINTITWDRVLKNEEYMLTVDYGGFKSFVYSFTPPTAGISIDGIFDSECTESIKIPDELTGLNSITVKLNCNNTSEKEMTAVCLVGFYDENGKLIKIEASDIITAFPLEEDEKQISFITPENILDVDGIKVFVWENLDTLKPVCNPYCIFDTNWKASGKLSDTSALNLVTTFYDDGGRGFAWAAAEEHTDMAIRYAKADDEWYDESVIEDAVYIEYDGRLYYKADIHNLEPGESYVYKIGDIQDDVWSDLYTFTTEPEGLTEFSFIGVTDPQSSSWSGGFEYYKSTLDKAFEDDSDAAFMINLGDMVNDGTLQSQWDEYFKAMKGYAESVPHMTVVGNHETRGDAKTAGKNFSLQFNNPKNGAGALGDLTVDDVFHECTKGVINNFEESVYSFDYGNAHFAVLNSGSDWSESDKIKLMTEQAKWLEEDLKSAFDKKWKIIMIHIGMYPAKEERYDTCDELTEVIDKYGVDLVLSGHDHMVARTYPMRDKQVVETSNPASVTKGTGMINAILGVAGPKRYDEVTAIPSYLAFLKATEKTQPTYSIFNVNSERISIVTKQIDGTIVDNFEIVDK